MIPYLLIRKPHIHKEIAVVLGVLCLLLVLPVVAVFSLTNVRALVKTVTGSNGSDPSNISLYTGNGYPGDNYAFGNCTYWVFMRRSQVGEPIPTTWGNASSWAASALLEKYTVDHIPTQYAIMQISDVDNGLGHVAFVESVDPDGTWHISEMNVVGFDEVDDKAMPASAASGYNFIHTN